MKNALCILILVLSIFNVSRVSGSEMDRLEIPIGLLIGDSDKIKNVYEEIASRNNEWLIKKLSNIKNYKPNDIVVQETNHGHFLKKIIIFNYKNGPFLSEKIGGLLVSLPTVNEKLPVVIALHGHEYSSRGDIPNGLVDQNSWVTELVEMGYKVWIPETMYHSEIEDDAKNFGGYPYVWTKILSEQLDILRRLAVLDETDVGVVGLSAGGLIGQILMASDRNIKFGVFGGSFQTLQFLRDQYRIIGHPNCWDMTDLHTYNVINMLLYPRPVEFQVGKKDNFFPTNSTIKAVGESFPGTNRPYLSYEAAEVGLVMERIYKINKRDNNFKFYIFNGGHEIDVAEADKFIRSGMEIR